MPSSMSPGTIGIRELRVTVAATVQRAADPEVVLEPVRASA